MTAAFWTPAAPRLIIPDWDDIKRFSRKLLLDGQFAPGQNVQMLDRGAQAPPEAGLSTLSLHASATSEGTNITWPGSLLAGDVAVLMDIASSGGPPAAVTPTGFSILLNTTGGDQRLMATYKILDGTETGSLAGMSPTNVAKVMYVFRGNIAITTVTGGSWTGAGTSGNPAARSVTASGGAVPLAVLGMAYDATSTFAAAFSTESPAFDATHTTGANPRGIGGYKIYNSSPADHSIDMNDLGSTNGLMAGYISCS